MTPAAAIEIRVAVYAAVLEGGRRLFEPGAYDPAAEDALEAAADRDERLARVARVRAKETPRVRVWEKRPKPPGACANGSCRREPRPGGRVCERCRAYLNAWARENRPPRAVRPRG